MLLCFDISNIVARQYFARCNNPILDAAGVPVSGAVGALRQVAGLINYFAPTHILVACDSQDSTAERRKIDPNYKTHRGEPDEYLPVNIALTHDAAGYLGWPLVEAAGWEADDVIASACRAYLEQATDSEQVVIVTGDKDLLALCSDRVTVHFLQKGGTFKSCGPDQCREIFGVPPGQVRNLRAIAGDPSDRIRGVANVGSKTAIAALWACRTPDESKTLGELHRRLKANERIDGVSPRLANLLWDGADKILLSWKLAGLENTLSIDVDSLDARAARTLSDAEDDLRELRLHHLFDSTTTAQRQPSRR